MRLVPTVLLAGTLIAGCASRATRVERDVDPDTGRTVRTEEPVVAADDEAHGCSGPLSCSADLVANVIAFPFRVIGGTVKALF